MANAAVVDYAQPDVQLNYKLKHNGSDPTGEYGSLDRFGRVIRHAWTDGNFDINQGDSTVPNIPPIVEMGYGFDKASRVTFAYDQRPGTKWEFSHEYDYDDLHRLKEAERGLYDGSTFTKKKNSQRFTMDVLANFTKIETDTDGTNGYESDETENRTDYSDANELNGRDTDNNASDDVTLDHDLNGNLVCKDDGSGTVVKYTFDAWNRLVKVEHEIGQNTNPVSEFRYNALHFRIEKRSDTTVGYDGTLDQVRRMYYCPTWQLVEERIDDGWSGSGFTADRHMQYIWGIRYIDDLVQRREDKNTNGTFEVSDPDYYHLTDPQFSTIAVLNKTAKVLERITYDAFGEARHHYANDVNGDGAYLAADNSTIQLVANQGNNSIGQANYRAECDVDRDGDVDNADVTAAGTNYKSALAKGELSDSAVNNTHGWSGYYYNRAPILYHDRFRCYDVILARWITRDPAGYVDSMNLYGYGIGNSIWAVDPSGLGSIFDAYRENADIPVVGDMLNEYNEGAKWGQDVLEKVGDVLLTVGEMALTYAAGGLLVRGGAALLRYLSRHADDIAAAMGRWGNRIKDLLDDMGAGIQNIALRSIEGAKKTMVLVIITARGVWAIRGPLLEVLLGILEGFLNGIVPPTGRGPFRGGHPVRRGARTASEMITNIGQLWGAAEACKRGIIPTWPIPIHPIDR